LTNLLESPGWRRFSFLHISPGGAGRYANSFLNDGNEILWQQGDRARTYYLKGDVLENQNDHLSHRLFLVVSKGTLLGIYRKENQQELDGRLRLTKTYHLPNTIRLNQLEIVPAGAPGGYLNRDDVKTLIALLP
jgi:hypothetical protein